MPKLTPKDIVEGLNIDCRMFFEGWMSFYKGKWSSFLDDLTYERYVNDGQPYGEMTFKHFVIGKGCRISLRR
jgi:hypothetical protein